jgi:hypothetical protein
VDFHSKREPLELLLSDDGGSRRRGTERRKQTLDRKTSSRAVANERSTSVVDHLFEGDANAHHHHSHTHTGGARFGNMRKIVRDAPINVASDSTPVMS